MRRTISSLACVMMMILFHSAVASPQTSFNHGGKIETRYDGVRSETLMRLQKMKVNCTGFKGNFKDYCVSIDVALHCPGPQQSYVGSVTLQLIFETRSWDEPHPQDQRELSVVTDTETLWLGKMRLIPRANAVLTEKMLETLETAVSYEVFKKIAQSQSIEFQIGNSRVELRDKNLAALRDLNNRVLKRQ